MLTMGRFLLPAKRRNKKEEDFYEIAIKLQPEWSVKNDADFSLEAWRCYLEIGLRKLLYEYESLRTGNRLYVMGTVKESVVCADSFTRAVHELLSCCLTRYSAEKLREEIDFILRKRLFITKGGLRIDTCYLHDEEDPSGLSMSLMVSHR